MSYEFDGNSDNCLETANDFAILTHITCSAGVYLHSTTSTVRAIVGGHNWNNFNHHFAAYGTRLRFEFYNGGNRRYQADNADLSADTWHHVAITYADYGTPQFYVDGAAVPGSWTNTSGSNYLATGGEPLGIGGAPRGAYYFDGDIAEAAEWSRELDADEIKLLYAGGVITYRMPLLIGHKAQLECYYPLNDQEDGEQAMDAKDFSGNGLDMSAQGGGIYGRAAPVTFAGAIPLVPVDPAWNAYHNPIKSGDAEDTFRHTATGNDSFAHSGDATCQV